MSKTKVSLGICAMEKKVKSKQMQSILNEISKFEEFKIIIFDKQVIFDYPIEEWPIVDSLIIFFSNGFPFSKGLEYVRLRKPFLINDFENQKIFWDRRNIFKTLSQNGIPTCNYVIFDRGDIIDNDPISGEKVKFKDDEKEIEKLIEKYHNKEQNRKSIVNVKSYEEKLGNFVPNSIYTNVFDLMNFDNINNLSKSDVKLDSNNIKHESDFEYFKNKKDGIDNLSYKIEEKEINDNNLNNNDENENSSLNTKNSINEIVHKDIHGNVLIEYDDHIEFITKDGKSKKLNKPFVEKPCNGDDHRIYIYYPPILGGGLKRLFRKTQDLSSLYIPDKNNIRTDKSYIYEEFLQTDGFDIKVYTIGPDYAHAEARKSPTLDGVVRRTEDGKEMRYPINLTPYEKEIARKIVVTFKQNVCGFDILRSNGNSYVCDVNGWSFVKSNKKYYVDCAILLRKKILTAVNPSLYKIIKVDKNEQIYDLVKSHRPTINKMVRINSEKDLLKVTIQSKDKNELNSENDNSSLRSREIFEELRSVVCVFRHADRSPKQKMKLVVTDVRILELFDIYSKENKIKENITFLKNEKVKLKEPKELKLKKPKQLDHVLKIATEIVKDKEYYTNNNNEIDDHFIDKMIQLKMILETNKNFMGMTRKIQIRPLKYHKEYDEIIKNEKYVVTEALFIFKWGGDLTHAGVRQAKLLGNTFRLQVYPPNSKDLNENGLIRLHSTYRHDLKVYSSDEGRCMKSGAAFLQGLLQLDGSLIPIIFSMIRKDDPVLDILDDSNEEVSNLKKEIKNDLSDLLHYDGNLVDKFKDYILTKNKKENTPTNKDSNIKDENEFSSKKNAINNDEIENYDEIGIKKYGSKNSNNEKKNNTLIDEMEKNFDKALEKLMEKIGNPLVQLKSIYSLIKDLLEIIKKNLTKEEMDETDSYFIKSKICLLSRKMSFELNNNKGGELLLTNNTQNGENKKMIEKLDSTEKKENTIENTESTECENEKIILIYKRWIKIFNDYYDEKKNKFDTSKIPDIYDNIKYDLIHNQFLRCKTTDELFEKSMYLADFISPQEYGITLNSKIFIGLKVIKPLLNKIFNDLLWWRNYKDLENKNVGFEKENETFSGLDRDKINDEINSVWRHIKTRFYFTSASHLYSLINVICYGIDSLLLEKNEKNFIDDLNKIRLELDYCSHLMFRLYENLDLKDDDVNRFRLEIILCPGANKPPYEADEFHTVGLNPWIILNKNLTLNEVTSFFESLKL